MIGAPPDKSKEQDEPDEDSAHPQQTIHDNCPRIPEFKQKNQDDNNDDKWPHSEQEIMKAEPT